MLLVRQAAARLTHVRHLSATRFMDPHADKVGLRVDDLFNVRSKNVLVTGGSKGIGLMIAKGFVANGANVYICARNAEAVRGAADDLNAEGPGRAAGLVADLSKDDGIASLVDALSADPALSDGLHCLVNNGNVRDTNRDHFPPGTSRSNLSQRAPRGVLLSTSTQTRPGRK